MSEAGKIIVQYALDHLGLTAIVILFLFTALFKVTKREIDPLGSLIGWIGKKFTKDVRNDVAKLKSETETKFGEYNKQTKEIGNSVNRMKKDVDEMKRGTNRNCETLKKRLDQIEASSIKSNDLQTIRQIRAHVLDFANSCMNKRKHTKLEFENIIEENKQYKRLIKKYNIENDVYKEDYNFIMKVYHKCQNEGSFLNEKGA